MEGAEAVQQKVMDLQCQALSKCINAVRGARKELVSEIAGVESPRMALDATQARLLGEILRDPTALGDIWSGLGKAVHAAEVEEGTNWEEGRSWKDCGPQWDNADGDGFISVMSRILNKAAEIGEGDKGLSVGRRERSRRLSSKRIKTRRLTSGN